MAHLRILLTVNLNFSDVHVRAKISDGGRGRGGGSLGVFGYRYGEVRGGGRRGEEEEEEQDCCCQPHEVIRVIGCSVLINQLVNQQLIRLIGYRVKGRISRI